MSIWQNQQNNSVPSKNSDQPGNYQVGNFIIGASGSDKQMLFASPGARAALNIATEKSKQKM